MSHGMSDHNMAGFWNYCYRGVRKQDGATHNKIIKNDVILLKKDELYDYMTGRDAIHNRIWAMSTKFSVDIDEKKFL